jgi:hypothetical protein
MPELVRIVQEATTHWRTVTTNLLAPVDMGAPARRVYAGAGRTVTQYKESFAATMWKQKYQPR